MFSTKIAMRVQLFTDNNLWLEVLGSRTSSRNLAFSYPHLSYGVALWVGCTNSNFSKTFSILKESNKNNCQTPKSRVVRPDLKCL